LIQIIGICCCPTGQCGEAKSAGLWLNASKPESRLEAAVQGCPLASG
jgi:hypothetical protein